MFIKLKFFIVRFFYRIFKKKWLLSNNNYYLNPKKNRGNYLLENQLIKPDIEDKITFGSKKKLKKGWYFFGVKHEGDNRNSILRLYESQFFIQTRPAFPNRRRWRIIRKSKTSKIFFQLTQIRNPLEIKEIWIIKIPYYFAWFKIQNRIKKATSKKYLNNLKKSFIWKKYNNVFTNQIKRHKIFSYLDWIKLVEQPIFKNDLKFYKNDKKNSNNFVVLKHLKKVYDKKWILIIRENITINKNFQNVIKWLDDQKGEIDLLYGDEDHLSNKNIRYDPIFKSAWNKELFWSDHFYSSHWIINSKLWNDILDQNISFEKFDYDRIIFTIISKLIKEKRERYIKHISMILIHRNEQFYSFFSNNTYGIYLKELNKHLKEIHNNIFNSIIKNEKNDFLIWSNPKNLFLSIIIPTKDQISILDKCIKSIKKYSSGIDMEIIVVNNKSIKEKTYKYLDQFKIEGTKKRIHRVLNFNKKFNYSEINNYAVNRSNGNTILLLNNDVEFLSHNWDTYLASNAHREEIGCVGAKLIFEDLTIQHAGVILGIGGVAGHSHKYYNYESNGYSGRLKKVQEYSAVTAACLCITKSKWNLIGGLDEINLAVNYNDVDFCLRARQHNLRNIYLPQVLAIHHESKTRGLPEGDNYIKWRKEFKYMQMRWNKYLKNDPFYSPHLSKNEENWSLSMNMINLNLR